MRLSRPRRRRRGFCVGCAPMPWTQVRRGWPGHKGVHAVFDGLLPGHDDVGRSRTSLVGISEPNTAVLVYYPTFSCSHRTISSSTKSYA